MSAIYLIHGDITAAQVDAIVNAANPQMLGGGGVDAAIHRAAGPGLLAECRQVEAIKGVRCPAGEARITKAGKLNARYVIHTVGPVYRSDPTPSVTLSSAYRSSLALAQEYQCTSIAFPAISCGVYGYPLREAAQIALSVCSEPTYQSLQISFYLFNAELLAIWQEALASVCV